MAKKTVQQKQPEKKAPAAQNLPIQDKDLKETPIIDNDGKVPVQEADFIEPLANDIETEKPQGEADLDTDLPSNREMMDIIKAQNDQISQMRTLIEGSLNKPTVSPGTHTTWAYRYATYPNEEYGDGVIVSWRTKKGANVINKVNYITILVNYWDEVKQKFFEKEHDLTIEEFPKVILRSDFIEAKALFNEVHDARGQWLLDQKGDPVSKVRQIDPVSGTYILKMQPEHSNYNVVLPVKEFGGQNYMFNTRFLNI